VKPVAKLKGRSLCANWAVQCLSKLLQLQSVVPSLNDNLWARSLKSTYIFTFRANLSKQLCGSHSFQIVDFLAPTNNTKFPFLVGKKKKKKLGPNHVYFHWRLEAHYYYGRRRERKEGEHNVLCMEGLESLENQYTGIMREEWGRTLSYTIYSPRGCTF